MHEPRELDPLVRAALPTALHQLGNATQLLTGLNALLAYDDGQELFAARSGDVARAAESIERVGWLMGALGSASGDGLLQVRRAPEGLRWMVELLEEAERREGRPLDAPAGWPLVAPTALDGWQLPWGVARLLQASHADGAAPARLQPSTAGWSLELAGSTQLEAAVEVVAPRLPGAIFERDSAGGGWRVELPAAWFHKGE